jgi:hypothetical protein
VRWLGVGFSCHRALQFRYRRLESDLDEVEGICEGAKCVALRQCGRVVFLLAVLMSSLVARADSMSYQFTLERATQVGPGSDELQITTFVLASATPHGVLSGFLVAPYLQYGNVDTTQLEFIDGVLTEESTELDVVTFQPPGGASIPPSPGGGIVLATNGAVYFSMATGSLLWTGDPFNPTFLPGHYDNFNQTGSSLQIALVTPEPTSGVLLGTGMFAAAGAIRRKLKAQAAPGF